MENNTKNKTTNNANKAQKATTKNTANVKNKTANTKNCGKGCDCKERQLTKKERQRRSFLLSFLCFEFDVYLAYFVFGKLEHLL